MMVYEWLRKKHNVETVEFLVIGHLGFICISTQIFYDVRQPLWEKKKITTSWYLIKYFIVRTLQFLTASGRPGADKDWFTYKMCNFDGIYVIISGFYCKLSIFLEYLIFNFQYSIYHDEMSNHVISVQIS